MRLKFNLIISSSFSSNPFFEMIFIYLGTLSRESGVRGRGFHGFYHSRPTRSTEMRFNTFQPLFFLVEVPSLPLICVEMCIFHFFPSKKNFFFPSHSLFPNFIKTHSNPPLFP